MRLTLLNLTTDSILYRPINDARQLTLGAESTTTAELPIGSQIALFRSQSVLHKESNEWSIPTGGAVLRLPLVTSARLKSLSVPDEYPWRIYISRVSSSASPLHPQ